MQHQIIAEGKLFGKITWETSDVLSEFINQIGKTGSDREVAIDCQSFFIEEARNILIQTTLLITYACQNHSSFQKPDGLVDFIELVKKSNRTNKELLLQMIGAK